MADLRRVMRTATPPAATLSARSAKRIDDYRHVVLTRLICRRVASQKPH